MKIHAVIPAAGLGKRFGARKQFLELAGRPVLVRTLELFEGHPRIDRISIAVPEAEIGSVREMIARFDLRKIACVVPGGRERQDSVRLGFEALDPCDVVLIHDGVRPLVASEVVERTIESAMAFGSGVAAWPVRETVKRADADGIVLETVDRNALWSVQTPQAFRYDVFKKAVEKSIQDGFLGTDESSLVERLGIKVKIVKGDARNIKITTPEDLSIAEAYLRATI